MKPKTHKAGKNPPLQKVKEGFRRNHVAYTERVDQGCTVLEVKRKPAPANPGSHPGTLKQSDH